jgi:glucan phosphoethanolaminetransferase (alkaline phosphatase superfamily)
MENKEIKLYIRFPVLFSFICVGLMIILPLFDIIYVYDLSLKQKMMSILILILGIFMLIFFISANIFKKLGYIITKESITFFSLFHRKIVLWDNIVSYNLTGNEKKNDVYLNFFTEDSLKNKGILKNRYIMSIPTKDCKINIKELLEKINEIRE